MRDNTEQHTRQLEAAAFLAFMGSVKPGSDRHARRRQRNAEHRPQI